MRSDGGAPGFDDGGGDGMRVDLDELARLTAAQRSISATLTGSAAQLSDGGLCDWADTGPALRAATATADGLRELATRLRACGGAVDYLATDLARAGRSFGDAEAAATKAVNRWAR